MNGVCLVPLPLVVLEVARAFSMQSLAAGGCQKELRVSLRAAGNLGAA